jgi:hypothetical protein
MGLSTQLDSDDTQTMPEKQSDLTRLKKLEMDVDVCVCEGIFGEEMMNPQMAKKAFLKHLALLVAFSISVPFLVFRAEPLITGIIVSVVTLILGGILIYFLDIQSSKVARDGIKAFRDFVENEKNRIGNRQDSDLIN